MKIFNGFSQGDHLCPICGTDEDKPVVLIPIHGTTKGNIAEAAQVHADCLRDNLYYYDYDGHGMIAALVDFPYRKP